MPNEEEHIAEITSAVGVVTKKNRYKMYRIISSLAFTLAVFVHIAKSDIMVYSQMSSQVNVRKVLTKPIFRCIACDERTAK